MSKIATIKKDNDIHLVFTLHVAFDVPKAAPGEEEPWIRDLLAGGMRVLPPGPGLEFLLKMQALNQHLPEKRVFLSFVSRLDPRLAELVEFNFEYYGIEIERALFTGGHSIYPFLKVLGTNFVLSTNPETVEGALEAGIAAATLLPFQGRREEEIRSPILKFALDFDGMLACDEAERIYKKEGLEPFQQHEREHGETPLGMGPFGGLLKLLHALQEELPQNPQVMRIAIVTARSGPAMKRIIHTLKDWEVHVDELYCLSGGNKGPILDLIGATIFFDDQTKHCNNALPFVPTGHVPYGVANGK